MQSIRSTDCNLAAPQQHTRQTTSEGVSHWYLYEEVEKADRHNDSQYKGGVIGEQSKSAYHVQEGLEEGWHGHRDHWINHVCVFGKAVDHTAHGGCVKETQGRAQHVAQ